MGFDMPFGRIRSDKVSEIILASIDSAPVQSGEVFGPCLVSPGSDAEWTVGHWDGHCWRDEAGAAVSPVVWTSLPSLTEAIIMTRPATLASAIAILEQVQADEDVIHRDALRHVIAFLREAAERQAPDRGAG